MIALLSQQHGNYLKAYNYKRMLPQSSPYAQQLNQGIFSCDDTHDKKVILHALELLEKDKTDAINPIVKTTCLFVLHELSLKSFVTTIISQKNISLTLSHIANTPFCSTIITRLQKNDLQKDTLLLPMINCILAEFYYYSQRMDEAHALYKRISHYITTKNSFSEVRSNAFDACLSCTTDWTPNDITHLSSLCSNIGNYIQELKTTDPQKSYNIGKLAHILLRNNMINSSEKMSFIMSALKHLGYAVQHGIWNEESLKNILQLSEEAYSLLSLSHRSQKNYAVSLEERKRALECRSQL
ncbi:MAG TPA: hypothetical protein VHX42_04870, partial [Candidatus Babeliales bacterium]|nr:hypothetical protein [Candidatus Babeliales bacterium]